MLQRCAVPLLSCQTQNLRVKQGPSVPPPWCFTQTARQVGITLSFAFQGAERHETLPNEQKRGSRVTRCAILETRERLRGKGKPKMVEVSVGLWGRVIVIIAKATSLSLNELHCRWKAYLGTTITASQGHHISCSVKLFPPSLRDLA